MFYNSELMTNGVFRNAWLKGNNQEGQVESSAEYITNICNELSIRLEYQTARHRLSLRASAVLLSGTARIYRQELDRLYSDCVELNILMIRRRVSHGVSSPSDDQVSDPDGLPENAEVPTIHEEGSKFNHKVVGVCRNKSVEPDKSQNSNSAAPENRSKCISSKSYCSNSNCNTSSSRRRTRERGTQTSRSSIRRVSLDQSLPVGVTTVYDGGSGTPVGVICSNINPDIRRLYRDI